VPAALYGVELHDGSNRYQVGLRLTAISKRPIVGRMRIILLPLLVSTACAATSGPGSWRGFEGLPAKPDYDALDRDRADGQVKALLQDGAWLGAEGIAAGPFEDLEWFGKDMVIAKPRWGEAKTAQDQAKRLGVDVDPCRATLYRQLRDYRFGQGAVPAIERLCWTSDPQLLLTMGADGTYARLIWIPHGLIRGKKQPLEGRVPLASVIRRLCEGCNIDRGGAFFIEDDVLAHWKKNTKPAEMRKEADELFLGRYDWVGVEQADKEAQDAANAAAETAKAANADRLKMARARFVASLGAMNKAKKASFAKRLEIYHDLALAMKDGASRGGELDKYTDQLLAIDHAIADDAEHDLHIAEDERRVGTAAFLRLLIDRLTQAEVSRVTDIKTALGAMQSRVERARRDVARLAVLVLPTFEGNTTYADSVYELSDLRNYYLTFSAQELARTPGANPTWKLEVPEPVRGVAPGSSPPSPVNRADVLLWEPRLAAARARIDEAIAGGGQSTKTGAKKEKVTLGEPPYDFTFARWVLPEEPNSTDVTAVDEAERVLDLLCEEYERLAKIAPRPSRQTVVPPSGKMWSGPLQRTVSLTIDGETRTFQQAAADSSPERIPAGAFARLNQELEQILLRELRLVVEKRIADQIDLYGSQWTKDHSTMEIQLMRSILIERDSIIGSPSSYRQLVPNR